MLVNCYFFIFIHTIFLFSRFGFHHWFFVYVIVVVGSAVKYRHSHTSEIITISIFGCCDCCCCRCKRKIKNRCAFCIRICAKSAWKWNNENSQQHKSETAKMIYQMNDGSSRIINHDSELSSTIYCNSASIIQNASNTVAMPSHTNAIESRKSSGHSTSSRGTASGRAATSTIERFGSNNSTGGKSDIRTGANDVIAVNRRRMTMANIQYSKPRSRSNHKCRVCHSYDMTGECSDTASVRSNDSSYASCCSNGSCGGSDSSTSSGEPNLPYPGFPEYSMRYFTQDAMPRNWCLRLITNPWFERISILVILFNCITLGMYQPCVDDECVTKRCQMLQVSFLWKHFIDFYLQNFLGLLSFLDHRWCDFYFLLHRNGNQNDGHGCLR